MDHRVQGDHRRHQSPYDDRFGLSEVRLIGNKTPILLPFGTDVNDAPRMYQDSAPLLVANMNSFAFDFVARQKVHGQTLNLFIVEQLPVIAPTEYDRRFGDTSARELVRDHVLRLTYTAHDTQPFARDLGYDGPPFIWDPEDRRHLCARLDALYFHLYGLSREDAAYVLDTFPIVRRHDEADYGSYRTRRPHPRLHERPRRRRYRDGCGVVAAIAATVLDGTIRTLSDRRVGLSRSPTWEVQP